MPSNQGGQDGNPKTKGKYNKTHSQTTGKHGGHGEGYLGKGLLGKTPGALKGYSEEEILAQAQSLSKALYRPAMQELRNQARDVEGIYQQHTMANQYYLDWVTQQSNALASSSAAADQQLQGASLQIQQQQQAGQQALQNNLMAQHPGAVTSQGDQAGAVGQTLSPALAQGAGSVANALQQQAVNMASDQNVNAQLTKGLQANVVNQQTENQAQHSQALQEVRDAKTQVRLERASAAQQEVARLLEQEVAKAQARLDMRAQAAQLAIALRDQRMAKKQAASDAALAQDQLSLDQAQLDEEHRHNVAGENQAATNEHHDEQHADFEENHPNAGDADGSHHEHRVLIKDTRAAAATIGKGLGVDTARKKFPAFVHAIMEETGANYALAQRMARKWIKAHKNDGGGGGTAPPGAGEPGAGPGH